MNDRSVFWRLRRAWFALGLVVVMAFAGVGSVLAQVDLPEADPPVETTFLYDADGNKLAELSSGENRTSVELDHVSKHLIDAVLAAEDRDFFTHPGVDVSAIIRATIADLRGRPLQGGSTITQQLVKNVYLSNERSLVRKLKEATLAVKLERKQSKSEILERYLNTIYFGRGAHGVQAAAKSYFDTDVSQLDVAQSAYLAGLIRAPEAADFSRDPASAEARRDRTLRAMRTVGVIDDAQVEAAIARPMADYVRPRDDVVKDRYEAAEAAPQYFVEHVRRQLVGLGFTDSEINSGGLRVHTSLDIDLQRAAYDAVYGQTLTDPATDPAGALVAVDDQGWVRAMVGGRDWEASKVNLALGAEEGGTGRQPGSAFKPFALATAVADGWTVESAFESPKSIVFPRANNGEDYEVSNFEDAAHGRINLVDATRVSSNTVYTQLVDVLGPERVAETAKRLGIHSEVPPVLSIALGTPLVSVREMAAAYLTFATRGERVDPQVVVRVTDADGRVLFEQVPRRERVLAPEEADIVTWCLRQVIRGGSGTRASIDTAAAGKTGTTQENGDAWFVGYTPKLSTAVWMGYPEGQKRRLLDVHGVERVTGGTLPAEIWRRFMEVATRDERFRGEFGDPPDLSRGRVLTDEGRAVAGEDEEEETTTTTSSTTSSSVPAEDETTTTTSPSTTTSTTEATTTTTTEPQETTTTTDIVPG